MPTLGVTILIPQPWAAQLSSCRTRVGDPLARAIPPHVTLLPPTEVDPHVMDDFVAHLAQVAADHASFEMVLSGTASFRPVSPVVFVQVSEGISSCEQLERAVRSGPVRRELEFNYHPHVTIAHKVADPALDAAAECCADYRASFEVTGFDLYEQDDDLAWHLRQHFPLANPHPLRPPAPGADPSET